MYSKLMGLLKIKLTLQTQTIRERLHTLFMNEISFIVNEHEQWRKINTPFSKIAQYDERNFHAYNSFCITYI